MAQIELDGIKFTADNSTLSTGASKFEKFGNALNDDFSEEAMEANGGLQYFVNAVEIDWNGAQIGES